eukprot:PhF_6_TR35444/c0_g1_i5/m.51701
MLLQPTHNITKFVKEVIRLRKQRSSFPKAPKPLLLVGRAALTARSITDSGGTMHPDFVTTLTPEGIAALEDTTIQMLSLQQRCEAQVKGIEMEIPGVCCYVDLDPRRMSLERMTRLTETTSQTKCFPHLNKRRNPCLEAIFLHHASSSTTPTELLVSSAEENNLLLPTLRVGANVQWKKDTDDDASAGSGGRRVLLWMEVP